MNARLLLSALPLLLACGHGAGPQTGGGGITTTSSSSAGGATTSSSSTTGSTTSTGGGGGALDGGPDGGPSPVWDDTVSPPSLTDPTTIVLPGNYLGTLSHPLCSGPGYRVELDNTKDYIVLTDQVLTAPVFLYGGRNVHVIGIHIDLASAPCADQGASGYVPGTIALRAYQVGTTFIEGAYIDVAGRSADCIDPRNFIGNFDALSKAGFTEATARGARDVVIQNTVCRGMSGDVNVHGDVLQTQGGDELFRSIVFENVSADSNCEGTVIEPREGFQLASSIVMRRFDYRKDARYSPNPVVGSPGQYYDGGPVQHSALSYAYDQVYISRDEAPYELSTTSPGWVPGKPYAVGGQVIWGGGNTYACTAAGTSASSGGPSGTATDIVDGTVHWKYLGPQGPYQSTRPSCDTLGGASGGLFCSSVPAQNRFASPGTGDASSAWTGIHYASPH